MIKKRTIYIAVSFGLILACVLTVAIKKNEVQEGRPNVGKVIYDTSAYDKRTYTPINACDVLKLADAQTLLGPQSQPGVSTPITDSNDLRVTSCIYVLDTDSAARSLSLLVRSPKYGKGAYSNEQQFATLPSGTQRVTGYGDAAYWDAKTGQLHILYKYNWIIISSESTASAASHRLDDAQKAAALILTKI